MRILLAALALAAASVATAPVVAADLTGKILFSARQRDLIAAYARDHGTQQAVVEEKSDEGHKGKDKDKDKGKGKAKQKGLPPGIAMNLARGKTLPPGIAKKQLPPTLVKQLPPAPKGHEIVVVDGRVLLVDVATRAIRDRIENVVFR